MAKQQTDKEATSPWLQWFRDTYSRTGHPGSKKRPHWWHLRNRIRNLAKRRAKRNHG